MRLQLLPFRLREIYKQHFRVFTQSKASDTLGDFIRRTPRSAKIARCARYSDCYFRPSPRSAYKIADIWHVRYRRLNSPAFAKCARSRDFLRSLLRIASKANPSGWAILSHDFSKLRHRRDRRKKSPSVSTSIGGENRLKFLLPDKLRYEMLLRICEPSHYYASMLFSLLLFPTFDEKLKEMNATLNSKQRLMRRVGERCTERWSPDVQYYVSERRFLCILPFNLLLNF